MAAMTYSSLSKEQRGWISYCGLRSSFRSYIYWVIVAATKVLGYAAGCDGVLLGAVKLGTMLAILNAGSRLLSLVFLPVTGAMVDYTDKRLWLVKFGLAVVFVGS